MGASRVVLTGSVPETGTGAIATASRAMDRRVAALKGSKTVLPEVTVRNVLNVRKERALLP